MTIVSVETRGTSYERSGIVPLHEDILRRVRAVPGVERAGMTTVMPIAGGRSSKAQVNANGIMQYQSLAMAAVTAQPASGKVRTDRERLAAANAVAARHVGS